MARSSTTWRKGETPNPGGRPAVVAEIRELAQTHSRKAIETLVGIMSDRKVNPMARSRAAEALLDRALGRPELPLKDVTERLPERSSAEVLAYIDRIFTVLPTSAGAIEGKAEAPKAPEAHAVLPQASTT